MKNKKYRLLIIGDIKSVFILNFVKFLKLENPQAQIFFWGVKGGGGNVEKYEIISYLEDYYLFDNKARFGKIPIIRFVEQIYIWRKEFSKFVLSKHFDIVNIHFVVLPCLFVLDIIKRKSSNLVLTPWGSDVYRIGNRQKVLVRFLYKAADFVSGVHNRFTNDVFELFKIPHDKLAIFDLGSVTIDYIFENRNNINTENAKAKLNILGMYAITCGYNASPAQRHIAIVDAIKDVRNYLPDNLVLIFPFTYGEPEEYKINVKKYVKDSGMKALFFNHFMDISELFILRQATDMFIHVQTTDANSISLAEYLLCEKKVINGAWLRYDELEHEGYCPYFVVNDLEKLGETIVEAYNSKRPELDEYTLSVLKEKTCRFNAQRANCFFSSIV